MAERTVKANGIDIWTEDFGNPDDIPILLVMGASAQAILWEEGFIAGLVDSGRYVIRFDNRDTGQTTCFDLEQESYGLADMANDAVGVLDAYGLDGATLRGGLDGRDDLPAGGNRSSGPDPVDGVDHVDACRR